MTNHYDTKSRSFDYRQGSLCAENVNLKEIAETYGTPTYVYSQNAILDVFNGYRDGLDGVPHLIAFAVKANGNLAILNLLAEAGAGADLTSGGELALSLKGGIPADRMVYSGVGKTDAEIIQALNAGILMFNIESESELETIARLAAEAGKTAPIAIRVNPNIDAKTHPKITTGLREHKFGVPLEQARTLYERAAAMDSIEVRGIASHIGSSLMDTAPLLQALDILIELRQSLQAKGIEVPYIDIGGGLGIQYEDGIPETSLDYASKLRDKIRDSGATLIVEPGRSLVGNAGILLCSVTYVKRTGYRTFVIVDAGMSHLARPAIYGAYHHIVPCVAAEGEMEKVDVVGPICESSDVFGKQRELPQLQQGDLLAICSAGAYGASMASNYNGHCRAAEVLVNGGDHRLIRQRETLDDLLRGQII